MLLIANIEMHECMNQNTICNAKQLQINNWKKAS